MFNMDFKNRKRIASSSAVLVTLLVAAILVFWFRSSSKKLGKQSGGFDGDSWERGILAGSDFSNLTKEQKITKIRQVVSTSVFGDDAYEFGNVCATDECLNQALVLVDSMDFTVDPCEDFYEFACGKYDQNNFVPPSRSRSWDKWTALAFRKHLMMKKLLIFPNIANDTLAINKAHAFFESCATFELEESCLQPIIDVVGSYGGMPTLTPSWDTTSFNLSRTIGSFLGKFSLASILRSSLTLSSSLTSKIMLEGPIMRIDEETSLNNLRTRQLFMGVMKEMGDNLKLELNDSYLMDEYNNMKIFEENITRLQPQNESETGGRETHSKNLEEWLVYDKLEALLEANSKHLNATLGEYLKAVNTEGAAGISPLLKLNWRVVLEEQYKDSDVQPEDQDDILISRILNLTLLEDLIEETGPRTVSNYLNWRLIRHLLPYTTFSMGYPKPDETFPVGGCRILDTEAKEPMCMGIALNKFETALEYSIFKYFLLPVVNKGLAKDIAENVRNAFMEKVEEAAWISETTRAEALEKIQEMIHNVAYPDPSTDNIFNETYLDGVYEKLTIHTHGNSYFKNILNLKSWEARINLEQLRVPIQRNTWMLSPTSPTASHVYSQNAITIPAGILSSSFFFPTGYQSANYGSIGFVIGHEISHGFEAGGINYKADGSRQQWWTGEDAVRFMDKAKCFVDQYNALETPSGNINGTKTLNENIADNAGLDAALRAYRDLKLNNSSKQRDARLFGLEALKPEQIFFLSFASTFCSSLNPYGLERYLNKDEHTPPRYRILAVLRNSEAFSKAWSCKPGKGMNPSKKCSFW